MKKTSIIYNLLGVLLCGAFTPAAADFCSQTCNDCCEWSILDGKATIGADWLYWKVQQDGVLPGVISVVDQTNELRAVSRETIRTNPKWRSGFRVNLGYELPCECWDVNVCYTYLPSRTTLTKFARTENDSFINFDENSFATFESKWKLNFNNIDFDIGRSVCFGECLKMRPHVGVRATWFEQRFRSFGTNPISGIAAVFPYEFARRQFKQDFQGYGVEAGLWADYNLGCGLSLVGHFGGSILYSKFQVRQHASFGITNSEDNSVTTEILREKGSFYTATPSLDYFVGMMYAGTMCDMIFNLHAGWEQHVFFDTNRFLANGNLSGQGLTLGLGLGF